MYNRKNNIFSKTASLYRFRYVLSKSKLLIFLLFKQKYGRFQRYVEKQGNIPGGSLLGKGSPIQGPETGQKTCVMCLSHFVHVSLTSEYLLDS
jgi:hypothetical protein